MPDKKSAPTRPKKKGPKPKLTVKQQLFIDNYVITGNATAAALAAGYSPKTAARTGSENLYKPLIKREIDKQIAEMRSESIADQEEVLQHLTAVMRGEKKGGAMLGLGQGAEKVIESMPPTVSEQTRAAELLARRYGLFNDKLDVKQTAAVQIYDDIEE